MNISLVSRLKENKNVKYVGARLSRGMVLHHPVGADQLFGSETWWVDAVGIDPETEHLFRSLSGLRGRMLEPGERGVTVMESKVAAEWNIDLEDSVMLSMERGAQRIPLRVVGLFDTERLADFQRPTVYMALAELQELRKEQDVVSVIDIILHDASPESLQASHREVEQLLDREGLKNICRVESASGRQSLLLEADRITRLILIFVAIIAMATSFFIILTTMSMNLFARTAALGAMRCTGATRAQMAALLATEMIPPGVVGTALGMLVGIVLLRLFPLLDPHRIPEIQVGPWGMSLAIISGLTTTLICTLVLIYQVCRVTPLAALNPQAKPARLWIPLAAGALGVSLILLHERIVATVDPTHWLRAQFAILGAGSMYLGYILLTPGVVVLIGPLLAKAATRLFRLPSSLTGDSFLRAPWRSTGVCWVMLVGVSLIVFLATRAAMVRSIWDFPGRLPEAFVWTTQYVTSDAIERVKRLPGVAKTTVTTDVECELEVHVANPPRGKDSLVQAFLRQLTRPVYVACEPDVVLNMLKVAFVQGEREEAISKVKAGGHVLIPTQTAAYHGLQVGDRVTITVGDRSADFNIAGVIQSPALDLAVTSFQATSYMQFAAASAMLGTQEDLRDKFGLDAVSMFMCNLDLTHTPPPQAFQEPVPPEYKKDRVLVKLILEWSELLPEERETIERITPTLRDWLDGPEDAPLPAEISLDVVRFGRALRWLDSDWHRQTAEQNWYQYRSALVLLHIGRVMQRPDAIMGSLHRLKQQVDETLSQATTILVWLPTLILAVASIGIGNLMMVSVRIRARQMGMLRAVGALQSQIVRLVLAESLALGITGGIIGALLGLHQAFTDNRLIAGLLNIHNPFLIPTGTIFAAIAVTTIICVLAGIAPARFAARSDVMASLRAT